MSKKGKITQIIGAVVDVNFESDLPEIYTALEVNNSGNKLILEVQNLETVYHGVMRVLRGMSLKVPEGGVVALLGPNGAGKTSMLNVINGFYHPQEGQIQFGGEVRRQMRPYQAARGGIARTFQNVALFKGMTTLDNIMTGRNLKMNRWATNILSAAFYVGPTRREEMRHREHAERVIDFLEIQAIRKTPVGRLPYGLQKRVELGRALAAEALIR